MALFVPAALASENPCASCHRREVQGYAASAMAHSIARPGDVPEGAFVHSFSGVRCQSRGEGQQMFQSVEGANGSQGLPITFVIGSGNHAYGFLAQTGDYLFESPLAYYTKRAVWDIAPGYERAANPDFSRPVTLECLTCHSDRPLPAPQSLNRYQSPASTITAIQCDRCHGPTEEHLKRPIPGSIINPGKLAGAARDSICEQCHLAGEVQIPNRGKSVADFRAGQRSEEVYTTYVQPRAADGTVKVISHSEQLALSTCARKSGGRLWCGTCHNPHEKPEQPAEYFRARCLACHSATLTASHATPGQDCVACHMPRRPAKDGGHTAFTDHRISRRPDLEAGPAGAEELTAWRRPDAPVEGRNLALALVTSGFESGRADEVIRGYRMLDRMHIEDDPEALTALGTILLKGKQPEEAGRKYARALELRADYAPYEVNIAAALLARGETADATRHLERAVTLDPVLEQAVQLLSQAYRMQNEAAKADALMTRYNQAMGIREMAGASR